MNSVRCFHLYGCVLFISKPLNGGSVLGHPTLFIWSPNFEIIISCMVWGEWQWSKSVGTNLDFYQPAQWNDSFIKTSKIPEFWNTELWIREFSGIIDYRTFFFTSISFTKVRMNTAWLHLTRRDKNEEKKWGKKLFLWVMYHPSIERMKIEIVEIWSLHVCSVNHDKRWMAEIVFNTAFGWRVTLSVRNVLLHIMFLWSFIFTKRKFENWRAFRRSRWK